MGMRQLGRFRREAGNRLRAVLHGGYSNCNGLGLAVDWSRWRQRTLPGVRSQRSRTAFSWEPARGSCLSPAMAGTRGRPSLIWGSGDDLVIDHIVFDPTNTQTIYAAGWGLYHDDEGDVFRSDDGGATWRALPGTHGKSIRALSMAPSDHNTLVIGALDGVFRSQDAGATWTRMTPDNPEVLENHASMKNFVSVAIDPHESRHRLRRHASPAVEDVRRWEELA